MYNRYEWDRMMWEEERRLLREVTEDKGPMTWRKFGRMITLGAMLRSHGRRSYNGNFPPFL
ncbi:MAG: hypothetical protein LBB75_05970 [Oscillospiraceae bacterium]|jgi:hypothetical protein|nr:hypothetical protein [Oscillospiraceae bacterium]